MFNIKSILHKHNKDHILSGGSEWNYCIELEIEINDIEWAMYM